MFILFFRVYPAATQIYLGVFNFSIEEGQSKIYSVDQIINHPSKQIKKAFVTEQSILTNNFL